MNTATLLTSVSAAPLNEGVVTLSSSSTLKTIDLLNNQVLGSMFESLPSATILVFSCGPNGERLSSDRWPMLLNQKARQTLRLDAMHGWKGRIENPCAPFYFETLPHALKPLISILKNQKGPARRQEVRLKLPVLTDEENAGSAVTEDQRCIIGYNYTALESQGHNSPGQPSSVWAFMFTDITQLVQDRLAFDQLQQELFQSKKLASLGTMISGVAHELNNPLAGISMRAELSKMALNRIQAGLSNLEGQTDISRLLPLCHQLSEGLTQITENCNKASVLVSDLLNYSRSSDLELTSHHLIPLLQKMVQALKSHPDFASIPLLLSISPELAEASHGDWIKCEPVRLEQVFYNLVKNARDALLGKPNPDRTPEISILLSQIAGPQESPQLCVSVTDNGPGIDPEVLGRIFDPFFSTKGAKGLGLGLSISYRTIEQHCGTMTVTSTPGEGTSFKVILPCTTETPDLAFAEAPTPVTPSLKDMP